MIKFLSYLSAFLLLVVYILSTLYLERGREISSLISEKNALMGNKIFLEKEIERRNEIEIQTSERLQELSRLAEEEKNKGGFAWNSPLPTNDSIVKRLRSN